MKNAIALNDTQYFAVSIGKRVLKEQVFNSKGKIPVYSANVFNPFGYIEEPNGSVDDFEHDYVLWGIDGNFNFNVKHKFEEFAITDHCGAVKIINPAILPEYLVYQLEIQKVEMGFDRTLRASLANMKNVVINIPTDSNGCFDKAAQTELIKKYSFMKQTQADIASQIDELSDTMVELKEEGEFVYIQVSQICDFPETNTKITKKLCQENSGPIPVYGCSKPENAVLGYIRENMEGVKYYRNCVTWNRNGYSTGRFFYRRGIFTTNEDHKVLEIKSEYKHQLNPVYLKFVLQNEVRKLGYGWSNKLGNTKIAKITIKIPVNTDGSFNLAKQTEIAEKYEQVYHARDNIIQHLQDLAKVVVSM